MPTNSLSNSLPRKRKKMYSFKPLKIRKVEASGNLIRGIPLPSPRSGHRIIYNNGNIYSFGGYNPINVDGHLEHILFKELLVYNIASKTWQIVETTGNAPDELASHCAAYYENQLFIFGGTAYPFGENLSNDIHVCNLNTMQWSKVEASGSPPSPQYGQAIAIYENKMYAVGGTTGFTYSNDVHCFDLATKEWKNISRRNERKMIFEPDPRYRHEIVVDDDKIFVFGGGTSTETFALDDLPVYDFKRDFWYKFPTSGSIPQPRRCHACVQSGADVLVFGGFDGRHSFDCFSKMNLRTRRWHELRVKLPYPLYFHAAALTDSDQLFIFGGMKGDENERTDDILSMWIKIPSLGAMCWEAVLHYIPHLAQLDKKKMFEMGIPLCYLKEVEFYSVSDCESSSNHSENIPLELCDTADLTHDDENSDLPSGDDYDEGISDDSWEDL